MKHQLLLAAAALSLASCGSEAPVENKAKPEKAAQLTAGEYEVSIKVDAVRSTDQTTPATSLKVGGPATTVRTCVPADGAIDPKIFNEASETCAAMDTYMQRGRMMLQYKCTRPQGQLTHSVDGDFTTEGFSAKVTTATYYAGSGDYELVRSYEGKRVGDCPAGGAGNAEEPGQ